jgi:hypothetical protein
MLTMKIKRKTLQPIKRVSNKRTWKFVAFFKELLVEFEICFKIDK